MSNVTIPQEQWLKIRDFLRDCPDCYVGHQDDCKRFIEAVLWIARSGGQWRSLPHQYGNWNSVYKRFARWCDRGIWERMLAHFADEPEMESLIIDSTTVRAHHSAAGAPHKKGGNSHRRSVGVGADSARRSTSMSTEMATHSDSR